MKTKLDKLYREFGIGAVLFIIIGTASIYSEMPLMAYLIGYWSGFWVCDWLQRKKKHENDSRV